LIRLKILKAKKSWWYSDHIGEEFVISEFAYHRNGANHPLNIKNFKELLENVKIYGNSLHMHTSRDPNGSYYGPIKGGGPYWEIELDDTNWKMLGRKEKLIKINEQT